MAAPLLQAHVAKGVGTRIVETRHAENGGATLSRIKAAAES